MQRRQVEINYTNKTVKQYLEALFKDKTFVVNTDDDDIIKCTAYPIDEKEIPKFKKTLPEDVVFTKQEGSAQGYAFEINKHSLMKFIMKKMEDIFNFVKVREGIQVSSTSVDDWDSFVSYRDMNGHEGIWIAFKCDPPNGGRKLELTFCSLEFGFVNDRPTHVPRGYSGLLLNISDASKFIETFQRIQSPEKKLEEKKAAAPALPRRKSESALFPAGKQQHPEGRQQQTEVKNVNKERKRRGSTGSV